MTARVHRCALARPDAAVSPARRDFLAGTGGLALLAALGGCASAPGAPPAPVAPAPAPRSAVLARDARWIVVLVQPGDDLASLAAQYLGDARKAWWIAAFNDLQAVQPGQDVVIPLRAPAAAGITARGYQTVPILCYHRFGGTATRMSIPAAAFEAQLAYLAQEDIHVAPLAALLGFLAGREPLPPRSVVLTIDDGYASTYEVAFPVLRRFGFPATLFLYTDFVGGSDAVSWAQMKEMVASGLVEIQPHSKAHSNLALRLPGETERQYQERLAQEIAVPTRLIRERLGRPVFSYAYPYGDVNEAVTDRLAGGGIGLGLTVTAGANAFFAPPLLLRRTMVFGDEDLASFKAKLVFSAPVPR